MIYYFAYGSNMDQRQMKERCPDSVLLGKAVAKNYQLVFTIFSPKRLCGCADIVASKNNSVWGLLYLLLPEDLARLDIYEGHPVHYKRFTVSVVDDLGKIIQAETYEVVNKTFNKFLPSKDYKEKISNASHKHKFPKEYEMYIQRLKTID
jgi:gamma-glutamylcyclotransferase